VDAAERDARALPLSGLARAQIVDCVTWLPGDLLTKLDRCLMAHGLEGRVPFVDPKVAAFAFSLPDRQKLRGATGKWLLRQWLDRNFPAARAFLPKRGFTVPVGEWIAERGVPLAPLVAEAPGVAEICAPDAVRGLFTNLAARPKDGAIAWTLLFYALWHRRHILGLKPAGDVFATLAHK
jgi:asparagine synthase (glutamine-hydrolysing)